MSQRRETKHTTLGHLTHSGLLEFGDGYRTKRSELSDAGFVIVRVGDLSNSTVILNMQDHISPDFRQAIGNKIAQPGDVLLTTKGTVGRRAIFPTGLSEAAYSPQICYFRPSPTILLPRYFYYWLGSAEFSHQASHLQHSTDMAPYISLSQLSHTAISIPPLPEQRAIAEVLGALDDKIAANALMVSASEELMCARFAADTIAGTAEVPLTSVASFVNGRNFKKDATGDGRVVIRITELSSGVGASTVRSAVQAPIEHIAEAGDILFSWSGSLRVERWFGNEGLVNQHLFKVIPKPAVPRWLVHQVLLRELPDFQAIAADKATTMGHIQRRHLERSVLIPGPAVVASVDSLMATLWSRALAAEQESLTLASLRDTLLPALMSGRLRVRDAEKQVEEAL